MSKIYWVSRHDLSPAQLSAIRDLHGADLEIVKDPVVFQSVEGLAGYIREHGDGFVYAVAGAPYYLHAALVPCQFGVFENHPARRQDGTFGLATVYHVTVVEQQGIDFPVFMKVWVNPNPMSDRGESLIPVAR